MSKPVHNPFRFGDPVEGDYYLERPDLANLVAQFLRNRIPVVLIGPRRFGKTSFLLDLLNQLSKEGRPSIYVDIFNITSHRDFLNQMLRALRTKSSWGDKLKGHLQSVSKWRPKVSSQIDPQTGRPNIDLTIDLDTSTDESSVKELIQDVLASLGKWGDGLILAIDEFQKISEINDDGWLEATLRTHMQQLRNTSFIFTGSRRSIIYDMLNNSSRPLYRFCQPLEFPIFKEEFTDWVIKRFEEVGISCDRNAIEHLQKVVQDTPNYVQMIGFHLVASGKKHIAIQDVDKMVKIVVQQNAYAYQTLLSALSPVQQRTLRLAAIEDAQIYSKDLLKKYEIPSSAALSSAIKALKEKEILDEEGAGKGTVAFDDPLFAIWLRTTFG